MPISIGATGTARSAADGKDVGGTHLPTHHTIYPVVEMPFSEFVEKFMSCGWVYTDKKEI
ncbi:MAG: hypothetical protein IGS39_19600 [Calothrix sp. C42_A2020_038]|nr:hypothetical protein [Calothrix sp. C42_A2020_038]